MSLARCEKHDVTYDTDFQTECPSCEEAMTMPFHVTCDECALTLHYADGKFGLAVDLSPETARRLAQELIDRATDCEDANELEQMT